MAVLPQLTDDQRNAGWRSYDVTRACGHGETVWVKSGDHLKAIVALKADKCTGCDAKSVQKFEGDNG